VKFKKSCMSMFYFFIAILLLSFTGMTSANAKTIDITFPKHVSPTHPATLNAEDFGRVVNTLSSGAIKVKVYPGSELYKVKQGLQFLTQGSVQMMNPPNGHFVAYSPLFELVETPFIFANNKEFYTFLYGKTGNKILKSLKKSNIKGITFADEGPFIIATKNRLITKPSDFRGLKIRTSGHPIMEEALRLLGASTTRIPLGEVYSAAQQGVINGVATTLSAYTHKHLYEVLPNVTLWPGRAAYVWVASEGWWNGLNPYYRHIIDITAKEEALKYDMKVWSVKGKYIKILEKHGGKYHELSAKELKIMRSKIKPLYANLKKKFGAAMVNGIMQKR